MGKVAVYRDYVKQVLMSYAELPTGDDQIKREVLFDMDIIGEQLWIQYDMTETGVANDFLGQGVPKEDIVLAFHAPYKRKYTEFGVE